MCTQSFHPECLQLTEADLDTILKQPHFICSECSENEQVQSEHQDLCVGACSYCIPYLVSIALNKTPLKTFFLFSQRKRSCICWNPLSMLTKTIQDRLNYVRKRWALFRTLFSRIRSLAKHSAPHDETLRGLTGSTLRNAGLWTPHSFHIWILIKAPRKQ